MRKRLPVVPMKSRRYVGEMEEIAKAFQEVGLTPDIFLGAADMYAFEGKTTLAERNPEDPDPLPTLSQLVEVLSKGLRQGSE
ncbi:MAG: DUF1932 domain-containing protein [Deltaproteobacteria bacterium]|nr:DUF1932 domain-containing protein [Deltaproteobacteria bacterium]MBW2139248.1 DUF1932 domain-containing protein [Deltaproteobacteria bacterium]